MAAKQIKTYLYDSLKTLSIAYTYEAVFNYFHVFHTGDHTKQHLPKQHSFTVSSHGTQET
jgi:hypothetical protein